MTSRALHFNQNGKISLDSRGLGLGLATPGSYEDFSLMTKGLYTVSAVTKRSEASVLPAVLQSAVTTSHFVLGQVAAGVPREDCVASVIGITGLTIVFG